MTGILMIAAGVFLILSGAMGFWVSFRVISRRKRRIREEGYQIYQ